MLTRGGRRRLQVRTYYHCNRSLSFHRLSRGGIQKWPTAMIKYPYGTRARIQLRSTIDGQCCNRGTAELVSHTGKKSGMPLSSRIRLISSQRAPAWQTRSPSSSRGIVSAVKVARLRSLTMNREDLIHAGKIDAYTSCWMLFPGFRTWRVVR